MVTQPRGSLGLKPVLCDPNSMLQCPSFLTWTSILEMRTKGDVKPFQVTSPGLACLRSMGEGMRVLFRILINFCFDVFLCSRVGDILGAPTCFKIQDLDQAYEGQAVTNLKATHLCRLVPEHTLPGSQSSLWHGTVWARPPGNWNFVGKWGIFCGHGETMKFQLKR